MSLKNAKMTLAPNDLSTTVSETNPKFQILIPMGKPPNNYCVIVHE